MPRLGFNWRARGDRASGRRAAADRVLRTCVLDHGLYSLPAVAAADRDNGGGGRFGDADGPLTVRSSTTAEMISNARIARDPHTADRLDAPAAGQGVCAQHRSVRHPWITLVAEPALLFGDPLVMLLFMQSRLRSTDPSETKPCGRRSSPTARSVDRRIANWIRALLQRLARSSCPFARRRTVRRGVTGQYRWRRGTTRTLRPALRRPTRRATRWVDRSSSERRSGPSGVLPARERRGALLEGAGGAISIVSVTGVHRGGSPCGPRARRSSCRRTRA